MSSEPVNQTSDDHQARVAAWMLECFGPEITKDKTERADRFVEEALELAQSIGWTADRGHALVDYVFGRAVGEVGQEVGGVMVTLAALCNVFEIDINAEAKQEVDRITQPEIVLKIRAKQAAKPTGSALPVALALSPKPVEITKEMAERAAKAILYDRFGNDADAFFEHVPDAFPDAADARRLFALRIAEANSEARAALTAALELDKQPVSGHIQRSDGETP